MAVPFRTSRVEPPSPTCPLTECMRLLTGAWTVNVIWYLRDGARRFSELRADLAGISSKTLTVRLRQLESEGLVQRAVMPTSPPTVEYSLTGFGERLLPAIDAIAQVGHQLREIRESRKQSS